MKKSLHLFISVTRIAALAVLLVALLAGWRLIRNEDARMALAHRILPMVQDQQDPVFALTGLRWPEPRTLSAESLRILDGQGCWLEFHDLRITTGFRTLIRRNLRVSNLEAGRVVLHRTPVARSGKTDGASAEPPAWRFEVAAWRAAEFTMDEAVAGFTLSAAATGSLVHSLRDGGTARVVGESVVIHAQTGRVEAALAWNKDGFFLPEWRAQTPAGRVDGTLEVRTDERRTLLAARADNLAIEWLAALAGQSASGRLSGTAELVHTPGRTEIAWHVAASDSAYGGIAAEELISSGRYQRVDGKNHLPESHLHAPSVRWGMHEVTGLVVRAHSEESTLVLEAAAGTDHPVPLTTSVGITIGHKEGRTIISMPHLEGSLAGMAVQQSGTSAFQTESNQWSLQIAPIHWNSAVFRAQAHHQHGRLRSNGFLRRVPLSIVPEHLRGPLRGGTAELAWNVSGFPDQTEGKVSLHVWDLETGARNLSHMIPSELRIEAMLRPDTVRIEAQSRGSTNLSLLAGGRFSCAWSKDKPWIRRGTDARGMVMTHASLEALCAPYLPEWQQARGQLKAVFGIDGWSPASITGHVVVADGFFEDVIHGATIRNIQLHANAESIDSYRWSLRASDALDGQLSFSGACQRAASSAFEMQAEATLTNFIFGRIFGTDLPIDGRLNLRGTGATARLTGNVSATPITIRLPRQLPPAIRSVRVIDINAPTSTPVNTTGKPRQFPVAIETDIRLAANRGVRVNGKQLRTEWRGRGNITGTVPELRLGGSIDLVRGSFMFLGRRFNITRGEIIIPSGARMAPPSVFVSAETRAGGATITLDVSGSADEPALSLSSTPPLDRNEIIARLLFGKSSDAVSPFQIAYLAYALDLLEGGGPLLQQLDRSQSTLGLDQIDLKQSEEESGLSAVVFGKRVLDRVYFEGEVGLEKEPDVFAVEAELTPSLILRTETSPRIREGISINWRKDY